MSAADVGRIQRLAETWPVVHLEADVPDMPPRLTVDGLVRHARTFALADLHSLQPSTHTSDFHCVWGWSRKEVAWHGIRLGTLLDIVGIERIDDPHVTIGSASGTYSSCLRLVDAAGGVLAWERDGAALAPEHGGPLRFVSPPEFWAYKDVKWVARISVGDRFQAGFWESRVADPIGRIPDDVEY
jgi:DMSO/TMAO reductase YedYZ molybdopterin-dependent catalytic subunit